MTTSPSAEKGGTREYLGFCRHLPVTLSEIVQKHTSLNASEGLREQDCASSSHQGVRKAALKPLCSGQKEKLLPWMGDLAILIYIEIYMPARWERDLESSKASRGIRHKSLRCCGKKQ